MSDLDDHDAWQNTMQPAPVPRSARAARRRRRRLRRLGILGLALVVVGAATLPTLRNESGSSGSASSAASSTSSTTTGKARDLSTEVLDTETIAERVDPAVVDITATLAYGNGQAAGTGMIITSSGEILTNNHVIEGADQIEVSISGRSRTYDAEVLGTDPADDVALLTVHGLSDLPTVELGDSTQVAVGDRVIAIGNALNLPGPPRVTEGNVAAIDRTISVSNDQGKEERLAGLIQTDAELSPGNSGGPLLDETGRVVGINTAAEVNGQRQSSTTGFAIPIEHAKGIVDQIENGDETDGVQVGATAFLGVQSRDVDERSATDAGALIVGVVSGGPAADAGLGEGDVVTAFGDTTIGSADALVEAVHAHDPGDRVEITWVDGSGSEQHATVHLESGPAA